MSLVVSQLAISCSSDDNTDPVKEDPITGEPVKDKTLAEQIAEIVKQPYSKLTPAEQKLKLEVEANDMLVQLDKTKSSGAIEAIENLSRLLDLNQIDIFVGKNDNKVEDLLSISGVYGIYTWNNANKKWDKTASTTELKFVFPAKKSQTVNNSILSAKGVSSDVKVKYYDGYNGNDSVYDNIFLPSSSDATLTIDGAQAATFTQTAKYNSKNQSPDEFAYKMTLNDGYTWEMNGKKGTENTSKALFTYNGKTLLEFNAGSSANIDYLIDNDELVQYRGKANGLIKLLDNFIIVADLDLATEAADQIALDKSSVRPTYPNSNDAKANYKEYYTALNAYEKKYSEGLAANFNKNFKLILVSKKDGTKIAEVLKHSEKSGNDYVFNLPVWNAQYSYWTNNGTGETFAQPYLEEVLYLKFNDNTEVSFSTYFSSGFEKLETKFEDFIKAFDRQ